MSRWLVCLTLIGWMLSLAGCASNDPMSAGRPQESTIPWNRPQSWEGAGIYGSAVNQGR